MRFPACEGWEAITPASAIPRRDPVTLIQPSIATAGKRTNPLSASVEIVRKRLYK